MKMKAAEFRDMLSHVSDLIASVRSAHNDTEHRAECARLKTAMEVYQWASLLRRDPVLEARRQSLFQQAVQLFSDGLLVNSEGVTWREWLAASGQPTASEALRLAFVRGESPAEHQHQEERTDGN